MTDERRTDDVLENAAEAEAAKPNGAADEPVGVSSASEAEPKPTVPDETVITPDDIESELDNLRQDLAKTNDRYLRLAAEFDNYRKRVDRERAEVYTRAQSDLARRLVEVVDDLERVAHYDESMSAKALLEGVQLVKKKLVQVLESFGLEAIEAEGAVFDPATMEAIATVEAEHPEEDEVVADVFQRGYRFKGQLLRPARVRVKKFEA